MAARRRRRGGVFVLIGFLTIIGVAFAAGVYAGRIWMARSVVTPVRVAETETPRRPAARTVKPPAIPTPQLTFYQELTAPLTAPPPPPKPAKATPPLVSAPRPGEQLDASGASTSSSRPPTDRAGLPAPATTSATMAPRFTVQVASYRGRPQAEALREALASAGHEARIVQGDAQGPVYRVQVGEFATRDAARALAARLQGERASVTPIVTPR